MATEPDFDGKLRQLLAGRPQPVAAEVRRVLSLLGQLAPDLAGAVKLGWGSINFRHKRAGFVCALFPYPKHVALIFEHGRQLSSPLLEGQNKQVRFVRFSPGRDIAEDELAVLLAEAIALKS